MKATWNETVIAESDNTVVIEGNHYFPPDSINMEYFSDSETTSECNWKGQANYYNINVDDEVNENAAWFYKEPKEGSPERVGQDFANYVAFWHDVKILV